MLNILKSCSVCLSVLSVCLSVLLSVPLDVETIRKRRKNNPYACTDWAAILREMRNKTGGNAKVRCDARKRNRVLDG